MMSGITLNLVMLSVIMQNVIMQIVIMLSVMAPFLVQESLEIQMKCRHRHRKVLINF